jgi:HSP20 family molecular chaperone IbpA
VDEFEEFLWRLSRHLISVAQANRPHSPADEPYAEITETGEGIRFTVELPGVRGEDLRVRVREDEICLTVLEAGRPAEFGSFDVNDVDPGRAEISYRNCVLEIVLPYKKAIF